MVWVVRSYDACSLCAQPLQHSWVRHLLHQNLYIHECIVMHSVCEVAVAHDASQLCSAQLCSDHHTDHVLDSGMHLSIHNSSSLMWSHVSPYVVTSSHSHNHTPHPSTLQSAKGSTHQVCTLSEGLMSSCLGLRELHAVI